MKRTKKSVWNVLFALTVLVFALAFASCGDPADDSEDVKNGSTGSNEVGGKTSYYYETKIVFSAASGSSGAYTIFEPKTERVKECYCVQECICDDCNCGDMGDDCSCVEVCECGDCNCGDDQLVLSNGKYVWESFITGTYTWNQSAKIVYLKPSTIEGMNKTQYKNYYTELYKEEIEYHINEGATIDDLKNELGITDSSINTVDKLANALVTSYADEAFSETSSNYSFSSDGDMFLQKSLPKSVGTDQLKGQTYHRWTYEKDETKKYVFGNNGTYTYLVEDVERDSGFYSYNSNNKTVYFRPTKLYGQTAAEMYDEMKSEQPWDEHYFDTDNDFFLSNVNGRFGYEDANYDPSLKVIGWLY